MRMVRYGSEPAPIVLATESRPCGRRGYPPRRRDAAVPRLLGALRDASGRLEDVIGFVR
jgi:hypothetical protein